MTTTIANQTVNETRMRTAPPVAAGQAGLREKRLLLSDRDNPFHSTTQRQLANIRATHGRYITRRISMSATTVRAPGCHWTVRSSSRGREMHNAYPASHCSQYRLQERQPPSSSRHSQERLHSPSSRCDSMTGHLATPTSFTIARALVSSKSENLNRLRKRPKGNRDPLRKGATLLRLRNRRTYPNPGRDARITLSPRADCGGKEIVGRSKG